MWGATFRKYGILLSCCFNPRARVGRDATPIETLALIMFQSTRPCGARRHTPTAEGRRIVSIHAPVWGATSTELNEHLIEAFQSTRPCGARLRLSRFRLARCRFNPRARVGRDLLPLTTLPRKGVFQSTRPCGARRSAVRFSVSRAVSIHAPVWGATQYSRSNIPTLRCFNPRARVGRDLQPRPRQCTKMFQSTRPCGARRCARQ